MILPVIFFKESRRDETERSCRRKFLGRKRSGDAMKLNGLSDKNFSRIREIFEGNEFDVTVCYIRIYDF